MRWSWRRGFSGLLDDARLILWEMLLLVLSRAAMTAALRRHLGLQATAWDALSMILNGLRFDLRIATIAALPSLAASFLAFGLDGGALRRHLRLQLAVWFAAATALLTAIDVAYFEEYGNQFDHFLFGLVFDDRRAIAATIWRTYPVLRITAGVAMVTGLAWIVARRLFRSGALAGQLRSAWANTMLLVLAFVTIVCCARGSVSRRPAQIKIAAVTGDDLLDKMVVNPFDTLAAAATDFARTRQGSHGLQHFLHGSEIGAAAQRHFGTNAELSSLDAYCTRSAPGARRPPRHVVLVVMESYSAWALEPRFRGLHLGDSLLGLADDGVSIPRFVSAGPGTMASLGTLMTGLPDSGLPLSYEAAARRPFPTAAAAIFHRLGYRTRFFYGGYLSWQRIGDFARAQGFDEVHGGGEIGNWLEGKEWGVDDDRLFDFARRTIRDDVPSFDVILSVSNHPPFEVDLAARGEQLERKDIPPGIAADWEESMDLAVLGHFRYADRCLGRFVRAAERGLTDPLFAITGDHYGRRFPDAHPGLYERLGVPFVLYGHSVLAGVDREPRTAGGHIDVLPTLVDLTAPAGFSYCAFGRNLLGSGGAAAGYGNSAAVTDAGAVAFTDKGAEVEGPLTPLQVTALRQRFDDLHALGWWRVRMGDALPVPPRVFDCRAGALPPARAARPAFAPMYAGHRGMGSVEQSVAPESTLSAFRAAIAYGLDFVEVDPRATADGVLVAIHDSTVDRTTYGHGKISDLTLAQVRSLRLRADSYAGDFSCERVPTFEDVLRTCAGRVRVLIDAEKTDRVDLIVRAIENAGARDWVVFDAHDVAKIRAALALDPHLDVMIRPDRVEEIAASMRQLPRRPVIVQLAPHQLRDGAFIVHSLNAKVLTNVFDEDRTGDRAAYHRIIAAGADILQTDRPDVLLPGPRPSAD